MSNLAMNKPTDYEDKRKRKILSNGKHDVVSIYQGGPFTVVPRRALNDKRICRKPQTYLVLSVLCSLADNYTGVCFPTYDYIARQTQSNKGNISRVIAKLIDWGYIKRLRKGSPLYQNVTHKSSIYRILYDPIASDKEIKSIALNNDPKLQIAEENDTIKHLMKHVKKDQTSCLKDNSKVVERTTKTRLIELDSINNNKNNSIREEEVNEMVLMRMFKVIHFEVYKSQFIPNQKDWSQMTKIMKYKIPSKVLMQTIKRILLRFERNQQKLPSYPLGLVLSSLDEKEGTSAELIKDLAKKLRNIHR
jgi:DNA-binding MarR family transcriptional regulator/Tfp pilus assembly major pilin PilA